MLVYQRVQIEPFRFYWVLDGRGLKGGTWGLEVSWMETCGELWGGLNWFRLRLGREDFANAFT